MGCRFRESFLFALRCVSSRIEAITFDLDRIAFSAQSYCLMTALPNARPVSMSIRAHSKNFRQLSPPGAAPTLRGRKGLYASKLPWVPSQPNKPALLRQSEDHARARFYSLPSFTHYTATSNQVLLDELGNLLLDLLGAGHSVQQDLLLNTALCE